MEASEKELGGGDWESEVGDEGRGWGRDERWGGVGMGFRRAGKEYQTIAASP